MPYGTKSYRLEFPTNGNLLANWSQPTDWSLPTDRSLPTNWSLPAARNQPTKWSSYGLECRSEDSCDSS